MGPAGAGRHAAPIIARLHKALEEAQDAPEIQDAVRQGRRRDPQDELRRTSASSSIAEMNKWERVVKEGGIKAE